MNEQEQQARLQYLIELEISPDLRPEVRLLLAVLRQAVIDYFDEDPVQQLSAALYFAREPLYRLTLQALDLPEHLLPEGVDLTDFRRKPTMKAKEELDPLRLETLVRQLSGTQLKIVLSMGLLPLPASTRKISLNSRVTRSTTLQALNELAAQGLVERHEGGKRPIWSLPSPVRQVLDEVWGR